MSHSEYQLESGQPFSPKFSRRNFLKTLGATAVSLFLPPLPESMATTKQSKEKTPDSPLIEILEKNLNEFNNNTEALDQLFKLLNGLRFKKVRSLPNGKKFEVEIIDTGRQDFEYGQIKNHKTQTLPTFSLKIQIASNFQLQDLPAFNQVIATAHNEWLAEHNITDQTYYIPGNQTLADFWYFFADKLEAEIGKWNGRNTIIPAQMQVIQSIFEELGRRYGQRRQVSNSAWEAIWNLEISNKDWVDNKGLPESNYNHLARLWQKRKDQPNEEVDTEALQRLFQKAFRKVEARLQTQFRENLFHHCELEMVRKSNLKNDLKNAWGKNQEIIAFLREIFREDFQKLEDQQRKHRYLRMNIAQTNDKNKKREYQEELSELEIKIAKQINAIIYSDKIWEYPDDQDGNPIDGNYSFQDILEKEVNCMTRGQLIYSLWKTFFKREILAATTTEHFYSLLYLPNEEYWSLDGYVTKIENIEDWKKANNQMGLFSDFYQAGLLSWQASFIKNNNPFLAEILYREAIRLNPDDTDLKNQLASLLSKQGPERWKEAEELYREVIRLNPDDVTSKSNLATLLSIQEPERWKEAEELYREIIQSEKGKKGEMLLWFTTSLASLYDIDGRGVPQDIKNKISPNQLSTYNRKAIKFYIEALKLSIDNPTLQNWLSTEEILRRINNLNQKRTQLLHLNIF